jgi:hypothetical protein
MHVPEGLGANRKRSQITKLFCDKSTIVPVVNHLVILIDSRTMFKSLSLLALFAGGAEAFYLPGVNPQSFGEGEM